MKTLHILRWIKKTIYNFWTLLNNLRLKQKRFTIISNNCFAGKIYRDFHLPYLTPTVGLFFMAEDYIKLLGNLKMYLSMDITFIDPFSSKWAERCDENLGKYPIGVLGDIEVHFLHYSSIEEARDKWEKRCSRICWDKMIVKFNDQNGCTEDHLLIFSKLPFPTKICFLAKPPKSIFPLPEFFHIINEDKNNPYVTHEMDCYRKYINIPKMVNKL